MSTYPGATGLARPAVLATDVYQHIRASDEAVLESRVNAYLVQLSTDDVYLAGMHLGGSGDGDSFMVVVLGSELDADGTILAGPTTLDQGGTKAFFYKAATIAELAVQLTKCQARIAAWLNEGSAPKHTGVYVDYQMAGGAHGQPFVGMIVVLRNDTSPH
jgi:hypothetical protein